MNLIDQYLNQPKQSKTAATHKGAEAFLDLEGRTYHRSASSVHAARVVEGDGELAEAAENVAKKASGSETIIKERQLSDAEIQGHIKQLLNDGVAPKDVEARLTKLAEMNLYNHEFASQFLNDQSGFLGVAYIEPNQYMNSCPDTYQRMEVKLGGVKAASVKQIKACEGCTHFEKQGSKKRCSLYRLPIVASQSELLPIINNLVPAAKTAKAKKAGLVALANRENIKKTDKDATKAPFIRSAANFKVRTAGDAPKKTIKTSFTALDVAKLHQAGQPLDAIYAKAVKTAGTQQADAAVRNFVKKLKGSKLKVALSQIDCTKLGGKLSSSNAIIGERKCGSCSYRTGMHCGYTGGTLLNFPGMDKAATNHRIAEGAPKDGAKMLKDFDLDKTGNMLDIDINPPKFANIELNGPSKVDL